MKSYRVRNSRDDMPEERSSFTAKNDSEAKAYFEKHYVNNSNYDWDYLSLERVDVVEKVTHIGSRIEGKNSLRYFV